MNNIFVANFICPICDDVYISKDSESGIAGACAVCRDKITPNYISKLQKNKFVKLYLKENT